MFRSQLHRVDDTQNFVEIATGGHWISHHEFDFFVRPDHEHRANRGVGCSSTAVGGTRFFGGQHVVELGHRQICVANHRVLGQIALRFLDVLRPKVMVVYRVDRQSDQFCIAFGELGLYLCHVAEFGGADRCEVFRVRKQNRPAVANPLMKINFSLRCIGCEVGCRIVNAY